MSERNMKSPLSWTDDDCKHAPMCVHKNKLLHILKDGRGMREFRIVMSWHKIQPKKKKKKNSERY